jgi:hypothetical protein
MNRYGIVMIGLLTLLLVSGIMTHNQDFDSSSDVLVTSDGLIDTPFGKFSPAALPDSVSALDVEYFAVADDYYTECDFSTTYDMDRTMIWYTWQENATYGGSDDADEIATSLEVIDSDTIRIHRDDHATFYNGWVSAQFMWKVYILEWSTGSGVEVEHLFGMDGLDQDYAIGDTVVLENAWCFNWGAEVAYTSMHTSSPVPEILNTTHYRIHNGAYTSDVVTDAFLQIVHGSIFTVYRGDVTTVSTEYTCVDSIGATIVVENSITRTALDSIQNAAAYPARYGGITSLNTTHITISGDPDVTWGYSTNVWYWEVVESVVFNVQYVTGAKNANAEVDISISSVDVDNTIVMFGGGMAGYGNMPYAAAYDGYGSGDDLDDIGFAAVNLTSSTNLRVHRFDSIHATYGVHSNGFMVIEMQALPNFAPVNDQAPTLDNPSDTDNMYAKLKNYQITVYVSDTNGYADVEYLEIELWDNTRTTEYWCGRYNESANYFNEMYDAGSMVDLDSVSSSATKSGNDIDATFHILIDWDFTDSIDLDAMIYVVDTNAVSDIDWYELNWDVETRVDIDFIILSDSYGTGARGDYDSLMSISLTMDYEGSDISIPNVVDAWATAPEYGTNAGPFFQGNVIGSGAMIILVYADDATGLDTWTVRIVADGTDEAGATLDSATRDYITDKIYVYSMTISDSRVGTGDNVNVDATLKYYYDDSAVTTGTWTINGESATHQGSGVWRITTTKTSTQSVTYNDVQGTDTLHVVTNPDQNGQSVGGVYDTVQVQSYTVTDTRVDLNENVNIDVLLWYDYDDTLVTDGTVTINGNAATHQGSGVWRITENYATATGITYDTIVVSGNTHGIESVDHNGKSVLVVWDRILFDIGANYEWSVIDYNVTLTLTGVYEYDSTAWSGTVTWVDQYPVESTTQTVVYGDADFSSFTDPTYGITGYTVDTVSVVYDWVNITSGPSYYWTQYSVESVYLVWGFPSTFAWHERGTWLEEGAFLRAHMNTTHNAVGGISGNAGAFSGLAIGPFGPSWYTVVIDIAVEYTPDTRTFDFVIWSRTLVVDILHSIHIEDSGMDVQDNWITFNIHSNWGNSTFTIADNMTGSFVEVGYSDSEGWYQIAKPTVVGTHWYWILVNGSHSGSTSTGQTFNPTLTSDSWVWLDFKFTVNPVTFSITELIMLQNNESIIVQGFWHTPNTTLTWVAYEAAVQIDTGVLTLTASGEYNAIYWLKNEPTTFNNFTLAITADSSTINLHSYSYILDTATYLTTVSGGGTVIIEGDNYFEESVFHENPPGFYITAETAATVAVTGIFIFFLAYMFVDRLLKKKRLEVESNAN